MPRRKKDEGLSEEAAEAGRLIAATERQDPSFKELIDEIRAEAKKEGKTVTKKMAEVLQAGIAYTKYKQLTLADAMLVMDFIERVTNKVIIPSMQLAQQGILEGELQRLNAIADILDLIPKRKAEELARQYAEQRAQEVAEELARQAEEQGREGPVTAFVKTLAETIAQRLGEETVNRLMEQGVLDEFISDMANLAAGVAKQTLQGGGQGG